MKNSEKSLTKSTLFSILSAILLTLVFTACDKADPVPVINSSPVFPESFLVGPEGGTVTGLTGNVVLEIPAGALDARMSFVIKKGPEDYDNDFIIRSIIIEPQKAVFKIPAGLHLKYNEALCNGKDPGSAECLAIFHFDSEKTFDKRDLKDMISMNLCSVNSSSQCIETEILSGGIFAVGEASLGESVN